MITITDTIFATIYFEMTIITKIYYRINSFIYFENDVPAISSVSSSWSTFWYIFFTTESSHPVPTVTSFYIDGYLIDKHMFHLIIFSFLPCLVQSIPNCLMDDNNIKEKTPI